MKELFAQFIAQITTDNVVDIVAKIGWPGVILILLSRGLDRLDHTVKGLSMALWMDLSTRHGADPFVRETARKEIAKLEARQAKE